MKKLLSLSAIVLSCAAFLLAGATSAYADKKPPPKPQPTGYLIITMSDVVITSLHQDGSTETFELDGRLHLSSKVILNSEDEATEFRLHANLMNALGTSVLDDEVSARERKHRTHVRSLGTLYASCV